MIEFSESGVPSLYLTHIIYSYGNERQSSTGTSSGEILETSPRKDVSMASCIYIAVHIRSKRVHRMTKKFAHLSRDVEI
jgi:hypothetical protein